MIERIQEYDVEEETDPNITEEEIAGEQTPYLKSRNRKSIQIARMHTLAHAHTHTHSDTEPP